MTFQNETIHPDAVDVEGVINNTAKLVAGRGDGDCAAYDALESFRFSMGWSDEKTADLYTRIEETIGAAWFSDFTQPERVTAISKALWQNAKVYA